MQKADALMMQDSLSNRRQWYTYFPEGSAEFLLVTRVLAVGFMASLMIIRGSQLSLALLALSCMLWLDHVLVTWWSVQVATDLELMERPLPERQATIRRVVTGMIAASPSIPAFLLIAPWADVLIEFTATRQSVLQVLRPVMAVLLLISVYFAQRALTRISLTSPGKAVLLCLPILQGLGVQWVLRGLQQRLTQGLRQDTTAPEGPGASLVLADASWVLMMIPWCAIIALGERAPRGLQLMLPLCGTLLAAMWATAQLAAIEAVQKQFVYFIRKIR